ncbi:MAG: hypothetical protein QM703_04575 [Gemmatales bacterium]
MQTVTGQEFWQHASKIGISIDQDYSDSFELAINPSHGHSRFWTLPTNIGVWPHFAVSVLSCIDKWDSGYLWPRFGKYPVSELSSSHNDSVRDFILRGAGVPSGWPGALRFNTEEKYALITVMFAFMSFSWSGNDDLYFVPDHGQQLVQLNHHKVIHVECTSEDRMILLVSQMLEAGYKLPTNPPDWTFIRPAWMNNA